MPPLMQSMLDPNANAVLGLQFLDSSSQSPGTSREQSFAAYQGIASDITSPIPPRIPRKLTSVEEAHESSQQALCEEFY